jgi:hypothetical protein
MKSEQINELAAALVKAQGELPTVGKDSTNPFFKSKYADLAAVIKAASPVLAKHGLAVSQHVTTGEDGGSRLATWLLHESGQYICEAMPLLLPKEDPQGQGSAITYARRYSYMAVLGLVADEDDDGNRASTQVMPPLTIKPELTKKLDQEQIAKLLSLAKNRGQATKEAAVSFINMALSTDDFTQLTPAHFEEYKKAVISTPSEPF